MKPSTVATTARRRPRAPATSRQARAAASSRPSTASLRQQAEAQMRPALRNPKSPAQIPKSEADIQRLLHEMQVHQVELELQNEELQRARDEMEAGRTKYTDLYDSAPAGYFTLDTQHRIQMVNLTGARLVGIERDRLIGQPFAALIAPESRPELGLFLNKVSTLKHKLSIDLLLRADRDSSRFVRIRAIRSADARTSNVVVVDITERRNHEQAVRESEARLTLGMNVAGLGLAEIDYTTGLNHLTAEAARLFGFGKKAVTVPRSAIHATFFPGDRRELNRRIAASLNPAGKGWFAMEHRVRWPDGQVRWLRVRKQVYFEGTGKSRRPVDAILAALDVTEQKNAEALLRVSEIRYRRLFEAAHDGVLLVDPVTRKITDANPFMTTLLGYSHAHFVGKELFEIGLLKDEAASQEVFRKLKRKHEVRYEDLPLKSRSGRLQQVEVVANLYQEAGHPVIQCNIRDITARKLAEREVSEKARLLDLSHDAIIVRDLEGHIRYWNQGAEALYGWSRHLAMGKLCHRLLRTEYVTPLKQLTKELFKTDHWLGELIHQSRSGRRINVLVRKTLDRDPLGRPALVLENITDITARKESEATQRQVEILAATNRNLHGEILQRQAVEISLRASEREHQLLLEKSVRMQEQLRLLSQKVLQVQEEERKQISRELHDVVAQTLTGINVRLAVLARRAALDPTGLDQAIVETQQLVEESVAMVHEFARELRPSVLDDLGLIPALETFLKSFTTRTGIPAHLKARPRVEQLDPARRTVLFRVAQEALTNVARHAEASRVEVSLQKMGLSFCMKITDDGKSFDVDRTLNGKGRNRLGLLGMRERLEMIEGTFEIDSAPGRGTTLIARIPLGKSASRQVGKSASRQVGKSASRQVGKSASRQVPWKLKRQPVGQLLNENEN